MAVILVGPPGAGKSTVGALVATRLGRPFVDADGESAAFYAEVGWSVARLTDRIAEVGYERAHGEWEPATTHAVERLVEVHPDAVVALGAGHTHPTRDELFARVRSALAASGPVVLLRPSPDPVVAVRLLRERCLASKGRDWRRDGVDWLRRWSTDGRDELIATHVLHTAGERPERTADRVVEVVVAASG